MNNQNGRTHDFIPVPYDELRRLPAMIQSKEHNAMPFNLTGLKFKPV